MRVFSGVRGRRAVAGLITVSLFFAAVGMAFAQSESSPEAADTRIVDARRHFELGVAHFDREEWNAALAEFLTSRELAPTKGNTKNAAICLRKVGRFDEALDMFEALLRDFPELPAADRELARREMAELDASVGKIEILDAPPGARVSIDGVDRGRTPLAGPVRLPAGTRTVRVEKDGLPAFETRVDLAGRRLEVVRVRIVGLTQAGRLRVTEKSGRSVDVAIDGSRVGTAPWDGALAPGVHSVSLRGEGDLGAPPTRVEIVVGKEILLELAAVSLNSELEVMVEPESAEIFVDGAPAGRGSWKGKLPSGAHFVEATFAGYVPFSRSVTLARGEQRRVTVELEPRFSNAKVELELDTGVLFGLLWGGDLESGCTPPCSSSLPFGFYALGHATYRFAAGVGLGVHAGYVRMRTTLTERSESHHVSRPEPNPGTVEDQLRVAGLLVGAEADYVVGATWPLTLQVSAGALLGAATDGRTGTFEDSDGVSYAVSTTQHPRASYFYVGPEFRVGYRASAHFEASLGAKLLVLAALARPTWDETALVPAGETDRAGVFAPANLTGATMILVLPGVAAKYSF
jgi:hypothetical protein